MRWSVCLRLCTCTGVRRQAHVVSWTRRHSRTWWRSHASCHLVAAAKYGQRQHQSYCAGEHNQFRCGIAKAARKSGVVTCEERGEAQVNAAHLAKCLHQGEVLEQQFGEAEVAFRTLDLYTSAVLEASLNPTKAPKTEWRSVMADMSQVRSSISQLPRFDCSAVMIGASASDHSSSCSSPARPTVRSFGAILASLTTLELQRLSTSSDG